MKSAELYEIEKLKEMESLVEYLFTRTVKGGGALFERRWRETHKNAEKNHSFRSHISRPMCKHNYPRNP